MFKKVFILLAILFLNSTKLSLAFKADTFISFVHLVDSSSATALQNIKLTYQSSTPSAIVNDWLLTTATIKDATISGYFKTILAKDKLQSAGLFLSTQNAPLDKMTVEERKTEIDDQLKEFFMVFGNYPKVVSAQVMDTQSLNYLQKKYGVLSFVFLPGQHPQVPADAGGYTYAPYIASNKNFFQPSSSSKNRNPLVVTQAQYLNPVTLLSSLEIVSQKQFNEFNQVTFWTNTANEQPSYLKDLKQTFAEVKSAEGKFGLNKKSLGDFSDWYLNRYPESTPAFYYKDQSNHLYQTPWYIVNFSITDKKLTLKNLSIFSDQIYDPGYTLPNPGISGMFTIPAVDLSGTGQLTLQEDLYYSRLKNFDYWKMSLRNQGEELVLEPKALIFKNISVPEINTGFLKVTKADNQVTWTPTLKKNNSVLGTVFFVMVVLLAFVRFTSKNKIKPPFFGLFLVLVASLVSIRSGKLYPFGLGFWGPHGHDAIFHLSLIQKFINEPFNLFHPQISATVISNYHLFFDYLSAALVSIFKLDLFNYYFIYFPLVSGITIVLLLSKLLNSFKYNLFQQNLVFLFVFFGSSLGFVLRYFQNHDYLTGESAFWSNQSLSMLLNPPFVLSLIFLLAFLNLHFKKPKSLFDTLFLILLGGLLAQTKVYAFMLLCLALILNRQLILGALVSATGIIISLPFSKLASSPFIFNPLWFIRAMFESADRVYSASIASAWQVFEVSGDFPKVFALSLFGILVFFVGNLGVRFLGLIPLLKNKTENSTDSLIRKIIFLSLLLPLLITQNINPWNSIQFLYYGLFFLSIYTVSIFPKSRLALLLIVFFGTFGTIGTIRDYLTKNSSSRVSHTELVALSALKDLPPGNVLSPLYENKITLAAPKPLYSYVSTAYISALTGQPEFLSDTINLDITGVNYSHKKTEVLRFYNTEDVAWAKQFLAQNKISYVYETPLRKMTLPSKSLGLKPLFTSGEINLYQVIQE